MNAPLRLEVNFYQLGNSPTHGGREGSFHHEVGTALVFSGLPTKVLAFSKGTFTQTRHRF